MDPFDAMLATVAARPAMYVGKTSLYAVGDYLAGYRHALLDLGQLDPLAGWSRWVEMKFLISHGTGREYSFTFSGVINGLLMHYASCTRNFGPVAEHGIDSIDAEHSRRFITAYGRQYHEPEETQTTVS